MKIELDMYQTLALAVLVLMLGKFLRERVRLLDKFCIPAPVIGGVLFAIFTCICYVTGVAEFGFDDNLKYRLIFLTNLISLPYIMHDFVPLFCVKMISFYYFFILKNDVSG